MTTKLVFTVPHTSYEILTLASEGWVAGITYDPLSTSLPESWLGDCERCLLGSRRVPLKVRRAVRCLASLRPSLSGGYTAKVFTGRKHTHVVRAKRVQGYWILSVRSKNDKHLARRADGKECAGPRTPREPLKVTGRDGTITATKGAPRDYRAPVVLRTLRMLLSAREASEQEISAILLGLSNETPPQRHSHAAELTQLASTEKQTPGKS